MKIKLLFFIESLEFGGAEKSLVSLLKYLDYTKYNVEVCTLREDGALKHFLPKEVTYHHKELNFGLVGKLRFRFNKQFNSKRHNAQHFWKAFKSSIPNQENEYDIAIGWGQGFATYYVGSKVNAKRKIAWVNTNYDDAGYVFKFDAEIYEGFDIINCVSPFVVKVLMKYISTKKLTHITNIIDYEEVIQKSKLKCPIKFSTDVFNIVSVGRLAKPKAFEYCLTAAEILKKKGMTFHWYIVGEGNERNFLENIRQELNLEKEITFTGLQNNPYSFIQQADLYVQTSVFEGLGRTLIEASMLHKPIVTTDFESAFDLVEQNRTGFITPKKSEKIAEAITKLYTDKDLYNNMIKNLNSKSRITSSEVVAIFDELTFKLLPNG